MTLEQLNLGLPRRLPASLRPLGIDKNNIKSTYLNEHMNIAQIYICTSISVLCLGLKLRDAAGLRDVFRFLRRLKR